MRLHILAFSVGVLLLQVQPALPGWAPWGGLGGVLLCLPWLARKGRATALPALFGCLLMGFCYAAWRADLRLGDELGTGWEGRDIEVSGVVASLPQEFSSGTRFEFAVERVSTADAVVPGRIMLSWYQGRQGDEIFERLPLRPGERWRFTVRLKRPHGNANPGGFDYEAWLLERNVRATGYVRPG